jgi:hypothetical protein
MAIQSGGEVVWDSKAYRIVSRESINERMRQPIRGDWKESRSSGQEMTGTACTLGCARILLARPSPYLISPCFQEVHLLRYRRR